ncbi:MAG: galactose-1-phosphate uridylyltransferase [Gammaproteobacteria bacterium]|nr:galactose-1-phosphate uridylyltransferase [Gammaproteobacteria bacterium]
MPAHHQRRWHPLLEQWVLIASASQSRPWSGATVGADEVEQPQHDPGCYLCPGVERAGGAVNPDYTGPWAFDNDFASLSTAVDPSDQNDADGILRKTDAPTGRCRVLCWSEFHHLTLAKLTGPAMLDVARLWQTEYNTLKTDPSVRHILTFENKGAEVGVSNRHPHGQIYASGFLTENAERLLRSQHDYAQKNPGHYLLQDLIQRDEYQQTLIVENGAHFKTIVPFAARFPFETWIVPLRHVSNIGDLSETELEALAGAYQRQAQRYDLLFKRSSPNITVLHNAPVDDAIENPDWCFHIVMQPPLRDSSTLKYLGGFEAGAGNIVNPLQPEQAAEQLRACSLPSHD